MQRQQDARVLLVSGSDVPKYQLGLVPTSFYTVLEEASHVAWDHAVTAESALAGGASCGYDALVFFCFFRRLSSDAEKHLRAFLEAGKGIVVVHSGLASFYDTEMWAREIVGVRYRHEDTPSRPKTVSTVGVNLPIRPTAEHPLTVGIEPFELVDEAYKGLDPAGTITPLFETDSKLSDGPVAWLGPSSSARIVVLEPGHTGEPFKHPTYREVLQRAFRWAAGRNA